MRKKSIETERTGNAKQPNQSLIWAWFWRAFAIVSLYYAWYCFYVPDNNIDWADNFNSAKTRAAATGRPMLLFFTGDWCVPCRIMKRTVFTDGSVSAKINADFVPVMIEIDTPQDAKIPEQYNVKGTPITIVTDSQGIALGWRVGGLDRAGFMSLLDNQNPPPKAE